MILSLIIKLMLILAITTFLLIKKENKFIKYFTHQGWSIRQVIPIYWILIFLNLILFFIYQVNGATPFYIVASYLITFLSCFTIFLAASLILKIKNLISLEIIGAKSFDLYWLAMIIVLQYSLLYFLYGNNSKSIFMMFGYYSITLVFWPIIESLLYLGMMFIPIVRMVGLLKGAVLVSLLLSLSHFNYSPAGVIVTFSIFGLLGCYLYIKTKRIIIPLLVHSSINCFVLIRDVSGYMKMH
jgi:membrane protease YdiL (CAAX protease family)